MAGMVIDKSGQLNDRQAAFVQAYLTNGFNATRAAIHAGYSKDSAAQQSSELLRNPKVREAVRAELDQIVTKERVTAELAGMAFDLDAADYQPILQGVSLQEARERGVDTRNIKKIKATRRLVREGDDTYQVEDVTIELHDRHAALEKLGRVLAMFTEKVEHGMNKDAPFKVYLSGSVDQA
jgi:phage terminase small subunit